MATERNLAEDLLNAIFTKLPERLAQNQHLQSSRDDYISRSLPSGLDPSISAAQRFDNVLSQYFKHLENELPRHLEEVAQEEFEISDNATDSESADSTYNNAIRTASDVNTRSSPDALPNLKGENFKEQNGKDVEGLWSGVAAQITPPTTPTQLPCNNLDIPDLDPRFTAEPINDESQSAGHSSSCDLLAPKQSALLASPPRSPKLDSGETGFRGKTTSILDISVEEQDNSPDAPNHESGDDRSPTVPLKGRKKGKGKKKGAKGKTRQGGSSQPLSTDGAGNEAHQIKVPQPETHHSHGITVAAQGVSDDGTAKPSDTPKAGPNGSEGLDDDSNNLAQQEILTESRPGLLDHYGDYDSQASAPPGDLKPYKTTTTPSIPSNSIILSASQGDSVPNLEPIAPFGGHEPKSSFIPGVPKGTTAANPSDNTPLDISSKDEPLHDTPEKSSTDNIPPQSGGSGRSTGGNILKKEERLPLLPSPEEHSSTSLMVSTSNENIDPVEGAGTGSRHPLESSEDNGDNGLRFRNPAKPLPDVQSLKGDGDTTPSPEGGFTPSKTESANAKEAVPRTSPKVEVEETPRQPDQESRVSPAPEEGPSPATLPGRKEEKISGQVDMAPKDLSYDEDWPNPARENSDSEPPLETDGDLAGHLPEDCDAKNSHFNDEKLNETNPPEAAPEVPTSILPAPKGEDLQTPARVTGNNTPAPLVCGEDEDEGESSSLEKSEDEDGDPAVDKSPDPSGSNLEGSQLAPYEEQVFEESDFEVGQGYTDDEEQHPANPFPQPEGDENHFPSNEGLDKGIPPPEGIESGNQNPDYREPESASKPPHEPTRVATPKQKPVVPKINCNPPVTEGGETSLKPIDNSQPGTSVEDRYNSPIYPSPSNLLPMPPTKPSFSEQSGKRTSSPPQDDKKQTGVRQPSYEKKKNKEDADGDKSDEENDEKSVEEEIKEDMDGKRELGGGMRDEEPKDEETYPDKVDFEATDQAEGESGNEDEDKDEDEGEGEGQEDLTSDESTGSNPFVNPQDGPPETLQDFDSEFGDSGSEVDGASLSSLETAFGTMSPAHTAPGGPSGGITFEDEASQDETEDSDGHTGEKIMDPEEKPKDKVISQEETDPPSEDDLQTLYMSIPGAFLVPGGTEDDAKYSWESEISILISILLEIWVPVLEFADSGFPIFSHIANPRATFESAVLLQGAINGEGQLAQDLYRIYLLLHLPPSSLLASWTK
ncbi:hypothetical protein ABW19_dt0200722 [Dactylella cylindrospora]|nr:hypothetical protein ABW19_dt0200722 [Dactylella cylindrospora]